MGLKVAGELRTYLGLAVIVLLSDIAMAAGLEEIVVTARKRAQPIMDAPVSVSILSETILDGAGIEEIGDATRLVPSLTFNRTTTPLADSYFIRRIGNLGSIPNFEPAVGVFVDGAFRSRNGAALGDLFDVKRIEVLRGPQTTLHGKNTTAGVISVVTNAPEPKFALRGKMSVGWFDAPVNANSHRLEAVINGPLSENLSARGGLLIYGRDDIYANIFNGRHSGHADRYTARVQLRFTKSSGLDARLVIERNRIDAARMGDLVMFEIASIRGINNAFGVSCPPHSIDERKFCRDETGTFELTSDSATLNAHIPIGKMAVTSITSMDDYESARRFDVDQLNIPVVRANDRQRGRALSQEIRVSGNNANVAWLLGGFYFGGDYARGGPGTPSVELGSAAPFIDLVPGVPVGEPGDAGFIVSDSDTRHVSLFASVDWAATDKLTLSAGGRWQDEDKTTVVANFADHARPTIITIQLVPAAANAALARSTQGTSWELSGHYRLSEGLSSYLHLAKGFKSGGFNGGFGNTPPSAREFGDETVRSYELGLKTTLIEERLRANVAIFKATYDDLQSAGWEQLRFLVNNAERVKLTGAEVDLAATITDRLSLDAAFSYVDAEYAQYTGGSCSYDRFPDNETGSGCDLSGRSLPFSPRFRARISAEYVHEIRPGVLFARIDYLHSDEYATNASLDSRHRQAPYNLVDLRGGLRFDRFEVAAWVRNAGDQLVVAQEGPSNLFGKDSAYGRAFAAPRSYGITVTAAL